MSGRRRLRNERGAAMLELLLTLPIIFTAIFGLAESARLMLAYTTLSEAARAGTRYATVHGNYRIGDCTQDALHGQAGPADDPPCVVRVVQNVATAAGLSSSSLGVQVRYPAGTNRVGDPVTVNVSYPFSSVLPLVTPFNVTIGSTSQGRICY